MQQTAATAGLQSARSLAPSIFDYNPCAQLEATRSQVAGRSWTNCRAFGAQRVDAMLEHSIGERLDWLGRGEIVEDIAFTGDGGRRDTAIARFLAAFDTPAADFFFAIA